jgi:hypothetical protein
VGREPDSNPVQLLKGSIVQPDRPVSVNDMTPACAAAWPPTCEARPVKAAHVQFDPARGLLVGTFGMA